MASGAFAAPGAFATPNGTAAPVAAPAVSGAWATGSVRPSSTTHPSFTGRLAARARGVADVLAERLGASAMEGLPVIQRADGTVGDVGTSWWHQAMGEDVAGGMPAGPSRRIGLALSVPVVEDEELSADLGILRERARTAAERTARLSVTRPAEVTARLALDVTAPSQPLDVTSPSGPLDVTSSTGLLGSTGQVALDVTDPVASRVGTAIGGDLADAPAVPNAKTGVDTRWDSGKHDLWSEALDALDERFAEQVAMGPDGSVPAFDVEADASGSLDEPDGLEPSTRFMAFKPQANHPEVTDTESYVSLLVNQELSRATSPSIREAFRERLRLIDGSTSAFPTCQLAMQG